MEYKGREAEDLVQVLTCVCTMHMHMHMQV